jgi:hypothetical protein
LAEFWFSADWPPYLLDYYYNYASLKFDRPTSVHRRGIGPEAAVQIRNTSVFAGERVNADIYQELLR